MNFLGQVNVFPGHVQAGVAHLGPLTVEYPAYRDATPRAAAGYARPHEVGVARAATGAGLWAVLRDVTTTGSVARLVFADEEDRTVRVELGREAFAALAPSVGERLYLIPRQIRVFES
jgi:ABC-type sulfate/molybdate transport systems ATPase subunit